MKKYFALVCMAAVLMSAGLKGDENIIKEDGVTIVNTTKIAKDVEGYNGPVPVKIYIKKTKALIDNVNRGIDYYQKNK